MEEKLKILLFGFEMFVSSLRRLRIFEEEKMRNADLSAEQREHCNYYLYTFLLHARKLYEFFRDKRRYNDDIIISEFCNDIMIEKNKDYEDALNKFVLHFTYFKQGEKPYWMYEDIYQFLKLNCLGFLKKDIWSMEKMDDKYIQTRLGLIRFLENE